VAMKVGNEEWIKATEVEATRGSHIFPLMAACEAALESSYGRSELARDALNLFGTKQHQHPEYGTLSLPTKEFLDGQWQVVDANWVKYPTLADCFLDRMHTLGRLAPKYAHYAAALAATDAETYVLEVSKSWASDPERAAKVIQIYNEYLELQPAEPAPAANDTAPATQPESAPANSTPTETGTEQ
jgi:flagellum-specific peptidoglycan hydrolase FlgJ